MMGVAEKLDDGIRGKRLLAPPPCSIADSCLPGVSFLMKLLECLIVSLRVIKMTIICDFFH
jgi:hypothetical protein